MLPLFLCSFHTDFKYQIPSLTLTSAFANHSQSDNYSVISLSESLQSEIMSEFAPEDTWSLCSFGSRTSCNSRYTSIETLLDEKTRKPAKSESKLLSVARYFTSSKMRRKFSRKKKQKSLLALRKFSVIEEYKQKSSGNLGLEIDDMINDSINLQDSASGYNSFAQQKRDDLQRAPSVEEYVSYQVYENNGSARGQYFDLSGPPVNLKDAKSLEDELIFQFDQKDVQAVEVQTHTGSKIVEELEKCIITEPQQPIDVTESTNIQPLETYIIKDAPIDPPHTKKSPISDSDPEDIPYEEPYRCRTPPLSEMSPVSMSPPLREPSPIRKFASEQNLKSFKTVEFEKTFLNQLRRQVTDYYPIAASPAIKRIRLNGQLKRSRSETTIRDTTAYAYNQTYDLLYSQQSFPEYSMTSIPEENSPNEDPPIHSSNSSNSELFSNKTNGDVEITSTDEICNILPEALTPSRLLMHANNPDRNVSECDKECDDTTTTTKREAIPTVDMLTKKRPSLPDASVFIKNNETKGITSSR